VGRSEATRVALMEPHPRCEPGPSRFQRRADRAGTHSLGSLTGRPSARAQGLQPSNDPFERADTPIGVLVCPPVSARQIGATPNLALFSAMKADQRRGGSYSRTKKDVVAAVHEQDVGVANPGDPSLMPPWSANLMTNWTAFDWRNHRGHQRLTKPDVAQLDPPAGHIGGEPASGLAPGNFRASGGANWA
jgi:hypothetical protein